MGKKNNNELRDWTEHDAENIAVIAMIEGHVSKESAVSAGVPPQGWDAAVNLAMEKNWIAKDAIGSPKQEEWYLAKYPPSNLLDIVDTYEQLDDSAALYIVDGAYEACREMLEEQPGIGVFSLQAVRDGCGPCSDVTWPQVKSLLMDDYDIICDISGLERWAYVPAEQRLIERMESLLAIKHSCDALFVEDAKDLMALKGDEALSNINATNVKIALDNIMADDGWVDELQQLNYPQRILMDDFDEGVSA